MIHSDSFDPRASRVDVCNRRTVARRAIGRGAARFALVGALATSLILTNSVHAADTKPASSVPDPMASALFQAGVELLDAGKWEEARAKFEASMTLYPAASTLLNIARCYEHEGKLALAWSAYQRAVVINGETQGEERKKALDEVAKKGLADIEPRLPRLKILTKGNAPTGLRVTQNGKDIPVGLLGTIIPVDPGEQTVFAEAPGFEPFRQNVKVGEGELVELTLNLEKHAPSEQIQPTRGVPTWSWISGGAGLLFLTGAAAFRIDQAFVEGRQDGICHGRPETSCPPLSVYDPKMDNERKNRDSGLFVGLGAVGVLGLGAAVVGFVMGPSAKKPDKKAAVVVPLISPTGGGLSVGGRF